MGNKMKAAAVLAVCALAVFGAATLGTQPSGEKRGLAVKSIPAKLFQSPEDAAEANENQYGNTSEDEAEMEMSLFRSTASVVQMEITTGLTTEYLDPLLLYPVRVVRQGEEVLINDYADLEKMGLEALYTPELLEAMSEADPENLEIQDWKAVMGDSEGACVVLGKDENGLTGITEFRYSR